MPRLKRAQEWILHHILEQVELHDAAHGFRRGRSIVTNAEPHVQADVVINVDMENFSRPSTGNAFVDCFENWSYSEQLATLFALICSEPEVTEVKLDQRTYYVQQSERSLPQGLPAVRRSLTSSVGGCPLIGYHRISWGSPTPGMLTI
ncbi:MAG: hypothetical protein R3C11_12755 [Planctomycetaceae bacterium]